MTGRREHELICKLGSAFPMVVTRSFPISPSRSFRSRFAHLATLIGFFFIGINFCGSAHAVSDPSRRVEPVYGAGPSTRIVALFFEHFSKQPQAAGIDFLVPERSTKHAGGVRASGQYLFGRTGRPLIKQEKAQEKFEILLGRVPVGFATSLAVKLPPLRFPDIERIFSGQVKNWSELGGPDAPIILVGRESTEAVLVALSKHFPSLVDAPYEQILKRDHAVVNFLSSPAGKYAIGFGALSNFSELNLIDLQGQPLGVNVGLVVDNKNKNNALVKAVEQYANGEEWRQRVEGAGFYATVDFNRDP